MTKRTRYFFTGAALVLGLGVGTGLVAYYKGDLPLFNRAPGPEELAYVPADSTALAYANVRAIMDSEFRQKLREVLPTGEGQDEFFNHTGIDIERDIQSVVAAANGQGEPAEHGLILIRGTFNEGRIEQLVREHNGTVEDYKGTRLIVAPENHGPNMALAFPEPGLAVFGSQPTVQRALDTKTSRQNVTGNADLMGLVSRLEGAGNTAWAVGGIETVSANPHLPAQVRDRLPGIEWVAIGAHVNGGVNGQLFAQAKDDQAAADLRAVVNGALAAGRLMAGRDQKIDALLNSLQVSGAGREVDLAFSVPTGIIDMIGAATRPQ